MKKFKISNIYLSILLTLIIVLKLNLPGYLGLIILFSLIYFLTKIDSKYNIEKNKEEIQTKIKWNISDIWGLFVLSQMISFGITGILYRIYSSVNELLISHSIISLFIGKWIFKKAKTNKEEQERLRQINEIEKLKEEKIKKERKEEERIHQKFY